MTEGRRRWISLGEMIGLAALALSALGLWISWKNAQDDKPTRIVEQKPAIPLVLRGAAGDDGRNLVILPVDPGHALESLTLVFPRQSPIEVGSDGRLSAGDVEGALGDTKDRKGSQRVPVTITARFVEMGKERRSTARYTLRYRWEGGGLFSGHSVRFEGLAR
jgi:hypothetical protein